ncbi:hypothetical protein OEZ86_010328 [Tetradesmus obliquus]|nr:hypothetical protein OEZ86_010328 [Tetradesmus obliquus]
MLGDEEPDEPEPEPEPAEDPAAAAAAAAAEASSGSGAAAAADEDATSQQDAEPAGAEGDAEGEEGENEGEGDGEQQEPPEEDEETKARKAAAKAEAAAAAAQKAAANQRPLAERFPMRRKVHLTLPELPPGTRAMLLSMSNFGGGGFKNIKSLQARLVLAEPEQQAKEGEGQEAAGDEAEEEEAPKPVNKGPKPPPKVLVHYRFDSVQGADGHLSQLLMLKLYKEYPDSAFAVWQQQQLEAELAALRAKAEEEGLDEEEEEQDLRLERGVWRVRVLGVAAGGSGPEDLAETVNNLLAYDGELDASGLRSSAAAKVAFPIRDTYFGGYAADAKAGLGLYVFANGGCYVGQYKGGKRQGQGLMVLPDGGLYRGSFAADKFDGQYEGGKRQGQGLMVLPDGGLYRGSFAADTFDGQGTYLYPDNSYYTGSWKAGKKHGSGTYWDTSAGCLRGEWAGGALRGQGQYDQPHYHFEGQFAQGVPAGPCSFTVSAFRSVDLPQPAASYNIAPHGPTLCGQGQYAVPPGAADEPEAAAEGGEPAEADPDKPPLPAWPKYEGLKYESGAALPCSQADVAFPPPAAAVAAI